MVSLNDLNALDNGSFERLKEKYREITSDESEVTNLVTRHVIRDLLKMASLEKAREVQPSDKEKKTKKMMMTKRNGSFGFKKKVAAKKQEKPKNKGCGINFKELGLERLPGMPPDMRDHIEGKGVSIGDVKLVIMKPLFATDLEPRNCRFSIPVNQIINEEFLRCEDKAILDSGEGIDVNLIQPCLYETSLRLKKWHMNGCDSYMLIKAWSSVIDNKELNGLHVHDIVQIWSFRCNDQIWLALVNHKHWRYAGGQAAV